MPIRMLIRSRLDDGRRVHPGRVLYEQWMKPSGISQNELARMMKCSARRVNEIVNGRRAITADTAIRLSECLGMRLHYWMALQSDHEIEQALKAPCKADIAQRQEPRDVSAVESGSPPSRPRGWPRNATPEYRAAKRREAILGVIDRMDIEETLGDQAPYAPLG